MTLSEFKGSAKERRLPQADIAYRPGDYKSDEQLKSMRLGSWPTLLSGPTFGLRPATTRQAQGGQRLPHYYRKRKYRRSYGGGL